MQLLTTEKALNAVFEELLKKAKRVSFAVAWASSDFESAKSLLKAKRKIKRAVVGTHFHHTSPDFIKEFLHSKSIKFVTRLDGTFHPKFYCFDGPENEWDCLFGSANFTAGAFSTNSEAMIHIRSEDDPDRSLRRQIVATISDYFNLPEAQFASDIDLPIYRYWYERNKRRFDKSRGKFGSKRSAKTIDEVDILNLDWDEYLTRVKSGKYAKIDERTEVLSYAKDYFREFGSLELMPGNVRKGIGGYLESDSPNWGWFGSMRGSGRFKKIMNRTPQKFSKGLDCIPPVGPVTRDDYSAFVKHYLSAFPKTAGEPKFHGLATATRLLAMKRPDYFVCFDSANKRLLSQEFGIAMHHHDYEDYWDAVVARIIESPWWNSRRPRNPKERSIWDGRAAFLDAIYYS